MSEAPDSSKPSLVARLLGNRLRAGLIGGGALLAVGLLGAMFLFSGPAEVEQDSYQLAMKAIDAGDYQTARMHAAELYGKELSFEKSGAPFYVLGAAAALESSASLDDNHRNEMLVLATRYLEEARERGFPPGREVDGNLRLANSLLESGQYARCLPIVTQLTSESEEPLPRAERILAGAYLYDSEPNYRLAFQHIRNYLGSTQLSDSEQRSGQILQARILMALKQFAEAEKVLASLPAEEYDTDKLLLQGQLALEEAISTQPPNQLLWQKAVELLQSAIDRDMSNLGVTAPAEFLLGVAHRAVGDQPAAIRYFSRVRRLYDGTPEGWSACLAEGELLLELGENEAALESLKQAARTASEATFYRNPWISLNDFRSRLREAFGVWVQREEYAIANDYAKALPPMVELAESVQMRGDAHRQWADSLARKAAAASLRERTKIEADSRQHYRTAAKYYAWLADLRFATAYYPTDIWLSSQQYLQGNDFDAAARLLTKYLDVELRERRPEAYAALARAELSLGHLDAAEKAVMAVLDNYPQHPETYRARLTGSEVWLRRRKKGADDELAYLDKARQLVEANLNEEALTPRSLEWRDSLFALGHVLSLEATVKETSSRSLGVDVTNDPETSKAGLRRLEEAHEAYQAAIRRLVEAVRRYPDAPQATLARYELAEAYRNSAKFPRKKLPTVLIQTTRVQLQREMESQLAAAYEIYQNLQERLNDRQEQGELTDNEQAILRNCYFARPDTLFDQGLFEEAIREYSTASNRFQQEPAALEAFVQIASCYRELGRPYEARGTLEQAKVVLGRIQPDADFTRTTRFDRQQWESLLDLLSAL